MSRPRSLRPSDAVPESLLVAIGVVQGLTGLLAVAVPMQFGLWWVLPTEADVALWIMAGLGVALMGTGWVAADGKPAGPALGTVLAAVLGLWSLAFDVWALSHLSFTLFMLFIPPMALLTTVLSPFGITSARRCQAARAKLSKLAAERSGPSFGMS